MTKLMKIMFVSVLGFSLLQGCSMKDMEEDTESVKESVEQSADDVKDTVEDSIDNVTSYFKENNITMDNLQTITDFDFAADEGRYFQLNGKYVYLYRVDSEDSAMQQVLQEAKDNGKVTVNITGEEMEYGARVNGNYLLLYDTEADIQDVLTAFDGYTYDSQTTTTTGE